ncbi:hypothetical protein Trydic_g23217 [Trypoxylus dichotomus]
MFDEGRTGLGCTLAGAREELRVPDIVRRSAHAKRGGGEDRGVRRKRDVRVWREWPPLFYVYREMTVLYFHDISVVIGCNVGVNGLYGP